MELRDDFFPFVKSDRHNYEYCFSVKGGYKIAQQSAYNLVFGLKRGDASPEKGKTIGKISNLSRRALFSLSAQGEGLKIYHVYELLEEQGIVKVQCQTCMSIKKPYEQSPR